MQIVKTDLSQGLKSLKLEMRSMKKLMLSCVEKLKGDEQEMRILKEDAEQAKTDLEPTAYTASFPTAGGKHPRGPHPPRPTSRSRGGSSRSGASTYKRPADTPHGGAADKRPKTHDYFSWCVERGRNRCAGCYQTRGEDAQMLTCGGCRVARFCSADHQKMASKSVASGGSLLEGRHKDVCGVLGKWRQQVVKDGMSPDVLRADLLAFLRQ